MSSYIEIFTMKIILCFIFLIHYSYCGDDNLPYKNYGIGYVNSGIPYPGHAVYDYQARDGDQYYDKEEKEEERRPCATHDVDCIRHALSTITGCRPTYGRAPDPFYVKLLQLNFAVANSSADLYDARVKGLNSGKIEAFYIDKNSDTLVLEVEFESIKVYSQKTEYAYYRKGKAPSKAVDFTDVEFKKLSLTLSIENVRDIRKSNSHVYAHLPGPIRIEVGPKIFTSEAYRAIALTLDLSAREALVTQAPLYMSAYLRSKICDFSYY